MLELIIRGEEMINNKFLKRANLNQEISRAKKVMKEQAVAEFIEKILKIKVKGMSRKKISGLYSSALKKAKENLCIKK